MKQMGARNLLTDVEGLLVGNAQDHELKSGVTTVFCPDGAVAAVQVLGGAPGTRETDLLEPHNTVSSINAIVLSGGSAFGLDAASGVQAALREQDIGHHVGGFYVPIVPSAILFDLTNGGDKNWGRYSPYQALGYEAIGNAARDFEIGSVGAGTGALTADCKAGLGSASLVLDSGVTIGAVVAPNAMGTVNVGGSKHFWAAPFELDGEFGGMGWPSPFPESTTDLRIKFRDDFSPDGANTTIGVIATDAVLSKAEAKRLAIAAHDGFSRAIWPAHTPFDGDLIFALATGKSGREIDTNDFLDLCAGAAAVMARAIARGVYHAQGKPGDIKPSWHERFG